jgi:hypothetical protein
MKYSGFFLLCLFFLAFAACKHADPSVENGVEEEGSRDTLFSRPVFYGEKFSADSAIDAHVLKDEMGNFPQYEGVVKGSAVTDCENDSCYLGLDLGDGTSMQVNLKNAHVNFPENLDGRLAIVKGRAYYDTISVAELKQQALADHKTPKEIQDIQAPEVDLVFEATGVVVK